MQAGLSLTRTPRFRHTHLMPRKKSTSSLGRNLLLIFLSLLIASLGVYAYLRFRPRPTAEIFVLETTPLTPGSATLSGTIRKSTSAGVPGSFYLVLDTGQAILLDSQDLDQLLGASVTATGTLTLSTKVPGLSVTSITPN